MRDYNITLTATTLFLARVVKIIRLDGFGLYIAEAETQIIVGAGDVFYFFDPLPGAEISAVKHLINGGVGSMEIRFAHSEGGTIDTAQLNNGFWDGARVEMWLVDRLTLPALGDPIFTGLIDTVNIDVVGGTGSFDIRGLAVTAEAFIQTYQPMCRTDLFSVLCSLNPDVWDHDGTVGTILDRFNFTVAGLASPPADGWFNQGTFRTASGFKGVIANWIQGSLKITMYQPQCIARLTEGEAIKIFPGCDKTAETCRVKFNNRINHQAEAHFLGINSIVGM
jgi:uncharacterized phage protein (TIGR02218 family)